MMMSGFSSEALPLKNETSIKDSLLTSLNQELINKDNVVDKNVLLNLKNDIHTDLAGMKKIKDRLKDKTNKKTFEIAEKEYQAQNELVKTKMVTYGKKVMLSQQRSLALKNKRILELHYNLLFALANYARKMMMEGYNSLQEEILIKYTPKTFENLIYFVESKMDFKKIVNLVCLINFTNHGFQKDQYDEIILKVIENYHIRCVYILLKMDSFGFFTIKNEIFGVSDRGFQNIKRNLFSAKKSKGSLFNLTGLSSGVSFATGMGKGKGDDKRFSEFITNQNVKVICYFYKIGICQTDFSTLSNYSEKYEGSTQGPE